MFNKVFLTSKRSKSSSSEMNSLGIELTNSKRILPSNKLQTTINLIELYNSERNDCNIIRLNCAIHPYCSNVLFNLFTEIVQNEGSDKALCFNFKENLDEAENIDKYILYKDKKDFVSYLRDSENDDESVPLGDATKSAVIRYNLIDDTQLSSNNGCNFVYHCGLDFLNNHVLRSNTFKMINPLDSKTDTFEGFNTMNDYHRHYDGSIVTADTIVVGTRDFSKNDYKDHLYEYDDLLNFKDCFKDKIKEKNGWFGFVNKGKIKIYDRNRDNKLLDIGKPLNNKEACEFVDMYPTRDLFYFTPKYNSYRHRIEKNWNYCLTYPSSATTEGIPFIDSNVEGGSLRAFLIDETYSDLMKISSMSKHGLKEGDYVNIYRDSNLIMQGLLVKKIDNDYDFYVVKNGYSINSDLSVSVSNSEETTSDGYTSYKIKKDGLYYFDNNSNFMTFSFKKLVDGNPVNYYVKILSRLPNWKFANKKITEKLIYEEDKEMIEKYQFSSSSTITDENRHEQFTNHIAKLSFSKTIYNDDVSEVIFTDDIDLNYLHDNLNRPLTNFYFTIVKNNKGYSEWYGDNHITTSSTIEYSHCFGRVICGFYLNPNMYDLNYIGNDVIYPLCNTHNICECNTFEGKTTVHKIDKNRITSLSGLNTTLINDLNHRDGLNDKNDTVNYYFNNNFYGDLFSYSVNTCEETLIQRIDYRFNTYQREHLGDDLNLNYCNIKKDDYDTNTKSGTNDYLYGYSLRMGNMHEGYYYQAHYPIQVRTISDELEEQEPKVFTIRNYSTLSENKYKIFTNENNYLEVGDYFLIYNKTKYAVIKCKVDEVVSLREFVFHFMETDYNNYFSNISNEKHYYRIFKPDSTIPNYATLLMDGTCKYVWRNIIQNGFDVMNTSVESYPFTNGRLYIMKDINLYLRRQNPDNSNILTNTLYDDYKIDGNFVQTENENNFYTENNMQC